MSQFLKRVSLARGEVEDFDVYPFSLPLVRSMDTVELHPRMTLFVGENGSGKSTLLEAMAVALGFNPEGGSRHFNFATRPSHSNLHDYLKIARGTRKPRSGYFLRAESFFNVATEIDHLGSEILDAAYGGRSLHEQSHGESFLTLMVERFKNNGLYLIDEPEAALSPMSQLAALVRFHDLIGQNSQFVIATHSPILMAYPDATIYACSRGGITPITYRETEHYRITHEFLSDPERFLRELLDTGVLPAAPTTQVRRQLRTRGSLAGGETLRVGPRRLCLGVGTRSENRARAPPPAHRFVAVTIPTALCLIRRGSHGGEGRPNATARTVMIRSIVAEGNAPGYSPSVTVPRIGRHH
jgi:predicted ATPase